MRTMTGGYDYLNARTHGMAARLLPEGDLRSALSAAGLMDWVQLLLGTPYEPFLGPSPAGAEGRSLFEAVDRSVADRTRRLSRHAQVPARPSAAVLAPPARALSVLLAEWDLANLLALLSGVFRHALPEETLSSTLAGGGLGAGQLAELARARDVREIADRLAVWGSPLRLAVRKAIGHRGENPSLTTIRLRLVRGVTSLLGARARESGDPVLAGYIAARVDHLNLSTAFLWHSLPLDRSPEEFFLPGGRAVGRNAYGRVLSAPSVDAAVSEAPPAWRAALGGALVAHEAQRRVSVFPQALDRALHRAFTRASALDPFDVSIPLAFLLRLRREGALLKLGLARIALGMPADAFLTVAGDV
jgi:vacuolar-type H+-ATPase subunit C/Vma6